MGYLREKYTSAYYLHRDSCGNSLRYGVAGINEFHANSMRSEDFDIVERLDFRDKVVLDIGCGRGEAVCYAANHGAAKVYGVDFSEAAIEIARDLLRRVGAQADLYCSDALEFLQFYSQCSERQKFDIVMFLDCVEHIPRSELSLLLATLLPLMKTTGVVAVNTPHFRVDNDVIVEGLKQAAKDDSDRYEETKGMHCNRYTRSSLKRFMLQNGFAPISHHLFVPHWVPPGLLQASRWSRRRAAEMGYPIVLPRALAPEQYAGWHVANRPFRRQLFELKRSIVNVLPKGVQTRLREVLLCRRPRV